MGGFSASGAAVVVLIGAIISVGVIAPVVDSEFQSTKDAVSEQKDRILKTENADFASEITEYTSPTADTNGSMTVEIENTGSEELEIEKVDFQLDGEYTQPDTTYVDETPDVDRSMFAPGETLVAEFTLTEDVDRVYITIGTGESSVAQQLDASGSTVMVQVS